MLESPRLFLSLSLSLSYLGFSIFSFSQAQPWLSYCFHSHLSLLAVPLIGITTIGGRRSSSLILYFLSLLFFFQFFFCLLDKTETPLTLILFLFFISLMNNILFQFWLAWWMGFLVWIFGISNNYYYWHFLSWFSGGHWRCLLKCFIEF